MMILRTITYEWRMIEKLKFPQLFFYQPERLYQALLTITSVNGLKRFIIFVPSNHIVTLAFKESGYLLFMPSSFQEPLIMIKEIWLHFRNLRMH